VTQPITLTRPIILPSALTAILTRWPLSLIDLAGFQTLPPDGNAQCELVCPLPGNEIVNLGHAMSAFSSGVLKLCPHLVVALSGPQNQLTKYSVAYFIKLEKEVLMRRLETSKLICEHNNGRGT
jgi:hypothetical protein